MEKEFKPNQISVDKIKHVGPAVYAYKDKENPNPKGVIVFFGGHDEVSFEVHKTAIEKIVSSGYICVTPEYAEKYSPDQDQLISMVEDICDQLNASQIELRAVSFGCYHLTSIISIMDDNQMSRLFSKVSKLYLHSPAAGKEFVSNAALVFTKELRSAFAFVLQPLLLWKTGQLLAHKQNRHLWINADKPQLENDNAHYQIQLNELLNDRYAHYLRMKAMTEATDTLTPAINRIIMYKEVNPNNRISDIFVSISLTDWMLKTDIILNTLKNFQTHKFDIQFLHSIILVPDWDPKVISRAHQAINNESTNLTILKCTKEQFDPHNPLRLGFLPGNSNK